MPAADNTIARFTTRARQLLLRHADVARENAKLRAQLAEKDAQIARLTQEAAQHANDYQALMLAKMLGITDGDATAAQRRLAKLIRDLDKCIALLSGGQADAND